jgi:hypothetical protein
MLVSLLLFFWIKKINSNEINDLTFKSDRLLGMQSKIIILAASMDTSVFTLTGKGWQLARLIQRKFPRRDYPAEPYHWTWECRFRLSSNEINIAQRSAPDRRRGYGLISYKLHGRLQSGWQATSCSQIAGRHHRLMGSRNRRCAGRPDTVIGERCSGWVR